MYLKFSGLKQLFMSLRGTLLLLSVLLTISGCGNDLSRGKAEQMIKDHFKKDPITREISLGNKNGIVRYGWFGEENYAIGHRGTPLGREFEGSGDKYIALSAKGLLTYKAITTHGMQPTTFTVPEYYDEYSLELTLKAKPFIVKEQMGWGDSTKQIQVILAEVDRVEVTGLTKPSDAFGQKMCAANFTVHYKPTPFGEVYLKQEELVKQDQMPFVLYDDGWRLGL